MKPIQLDLALWKRVQQENLGRLRPNRRSGVQVLDGLRRRYPTAPLDDPRFAQVVMANFTQDPYLHAERPQIAALRILREGTGEALYRTQSAIYGGMDILVGVELISGYVHCEGSDELEEELFLLQGLNEAQLGNPFLVWRYVMLAQAAERAQ